MSVLSQPVTILQVDIKSGTNAKGTWQLAKVKASDGKTYDTFEPTIRQKAEQALGSGSTVTLAYDEKQKDGFTNYDLKDVLVPDATNAVSVAVQAPAVIQESQPRAEMVGGLLEFYKNLPEANTANRPGTYHGAVPASTFWQEAGGSPSTFAQEKEARITRLASARTAFEYAASAGLDVEAAFDLAVQIERYAHDQWVPGDRELATLAGSVKSTGLPWDDAA